MKVGDPEHGLDTHPVAQRKRVRLTSERARVRFPVGARNRWAVSYNVCIASVDLTVIRYLVLVGSCVPLSGRRKLTP